MSKAPIGRPAAEHERVTPFPPPSLTRRGLTPEDIRRHADLGITAEMLEQQQVRRVTDAEARELITTNRRGNMAGIVYPYFARDQHGAFNVVTHRLRRDEPEVDEHGKPKNKYLSGWGDRRHLYITRVEPSVLADINVPIVIVEAEKSVLAVMCAAERESRPVLALGLGGCWSWQGRIGKAEAPNGATVAQHGPLPDFALVAWQGRDVILAYDANAAVKNDVRAARRGLGYELRRRGAEVRILNLPPEDGINGPDDYIGRRGAGAFFGLVDAAQAEDFERTDKGKIIVNGDNVRVALARLNVSPTYDLLAREMRVNGSRFSDDDLSRLWIAIEAAFRFRPSKELLHGVLIDLAHRHETHPVREYLNGLRWDGVERLDTWLTRYGGAEDTPYVRAVGALPLLAAVRRVRMPGVKFDELLILEGEQGTGKSRAIRTLCPNEHWFSDDLPLGVDSKQVIERTSGRWIVEAAELHGNRGREAEALKAFLSRQKDGPVRLAYARIPEEVQRQFVIIGTTNSTISYLKDTTGARRFWPVRVQRFDLDELARDRDQLWAEAAAREGAKDCSIRLDPSLWQQAAVAQEARRAADPWEDDLEPLFEDTDRVSVAAIWSRLNVTAKDNRHADRVAAILQRHGFTKKKKLRVPGAGTSLWWLRDSAADTDD